MTKKKYDSTLARTAGNILSGIIDTDNHDEAYVKRAVKLARAIIAEVQQGEPPDADA